MTQNPTSAPGQTGSGGSKGGEVAQQAKQQGQQAKQQGQQVTQQAKQQASQLANRGGEQVKSQLTTQKEQAAERLQPVQTALRETAQQLRKQGQDPMGNYADKAADGVERVSDYLRETEVDEMTNEVRNFIRTRPAVSLGAAAALGFLATRFLKSSSQGTTNSAAAPYRTEATALPASTDVDEDTATGRTATVKRTPRAEQASDEGDRSGFSRVR